MIHIHHEEIKGELSSEYDVKDKSEKNIEKKIFSIKIEWKNPHCANQNQPMWKKPCENFSNYEKVCLNPFTHAGKLFLCLVFNN